MIKKKEIIEVLIEHGLSIIESERTTDSKENFNACIKDIEEKRIWEFKSRLKNEILYTDIQKLNDKEIEDILNMVDKIK